jgi:predicted DCC family thiol-disulfide oxidoreductase YuxK
MTAQPEFILVYDGLCGFCNGTVRLIIRHDTRGIMKFAALQSAFGQYLLQCHPSLRSIDSLILVIRTSPESESLFIRSAGALKVAAYLGGWWNIFLAGWIIPRSMRDWLYDRIAGVRYRLFGKYESCPIPPPEVRSRFLE